MGVVETGEPHHYEHCSTHESPAIWFSQSLIKLRDGVIKTTEEVTERKRVEAETNKTIALLQQSEEIAEMAAGTTN